MHLQYLFRPKNPLLYHCSESFYKAMACNIDSEGGDYCTHYLHSVTWQDSLSLIKKLVDLNSDERIAVFFFLIQLDYLILTIILRFIGKIFGKNLEIYYQMHEPRFEKGRVKPFKAYLVFVYHFLFGYLADKILLPSDKAVFTAKSFIPAHKLYKINLSFVSLPENILQKNLVQLKCSWENAKTFSLLGRAIPDKNPLGFLDLVKIVNEHYPEKARFLRGGLDGNMHVSYDEDLIIRFPCFMSNSAKGFLFGLTHFSVIPYSFSTQSGVIAEALSYGKLLIVNDIPAFSYLKGLNFVFVIDFNDKGAILRCIHDLFSMDISDYENRYWEAVKYFQENHSETYLSRALANLL